MPKQTQLDKAIANLDTQIEVLQLARKHLVEQQQTKKPKKVASKPAPVAAVEKATA
jgi:hypothetical protein